MRSDIDGVSNAPKPAITSGSGRVTSARMRKPGPGYMTADCGLETMAELPFAAAASPLCALRRDPERSFIQYSNSGSRRWLRAWSSPAHSARRRRASGRADYEHRAGRVMRDLVGHRAEQEAPSARHALVPDDDQIGVLLLGDVEDRVGGISLARVHADGHRGLARDLRSILERRVDLLARADRPLHVP